MDAQKSQDTSLQRQSSTPESQESETPTRNTDHKVITLDLETTGLDAWNDKILLNGYRVDRGGDVLLVDPGIVDSVLNSFLRDPDVTLSGHNIKFDALFLANACYEVGCQLEDTKVLAYLTWPEEESHSLKDLVERKLRRTPTRLNDLLFKPLKKDRDYLDHSDYFVINGKFGRKDLIGDYHKEDILNVDRLRALMVPTKWFLDVEKPLTRILFEIELFGCPIDKAYLNLLELDYRARADGLLKKLNAGSGFNPRSNDQVAIALSDRGHRLEEIAEKTKTGAYSVDKQLLKKLAWQGDEFAKTLLEYRRIEKILGTYIEPFNLRSSKDGRLRGRFNQAGSEDIYGIGGTGTATGRLSSSDPNLQNIPSRTKEGKAVRKCFIASEGKVLGNADLKQIEPRLVGHYSQSSKLITAYRDGLDTHGLFANDIFLSNNDEPGRTHTGTVVKESSRGITPVERFIGKTSWLATVYGCTPAKLLLICEAYSDEPLVLDLKEHHLKAFDLLPSHSKYGPSKDKLYEKYGFKEAKEIYAKIAFFEEVQKNFIKKNPEIWSWRTSHIERTKRLGFVRTIGGRIIKIPGLDSRNQWERYEAERKAVNYQIQGSAADIMKLILVQFSKDKRFKGQLLTTVHDEVLAELPDPSQLEILKDIMENTVKLNNIRIEADAKIVSSWGDK